MIASSSHLKEKSSLFVCFFSFSTGNHQFNIFFFIVFQTFFLVVGFNSKTERGRNDFLHEENCARSCSWLMFSSIFFCLSNRGRWVFNYFHKHLHVYVPTKTFISPFLSNCLLSRMFYRHSWFDSYILWNEFFL
jgi:hypothetical protein